ncbi:MAG: ATP-binding protein [Candidatus Bathyarchaeia archaeon]
MDGDILIGYTYSLTGEYPVEEINIILLRDSGLAKGDLVYVNHPKNGSPVVYQVTQVYPRKRVREYEAAMLTEGRLVDDPDWSLHATAYQWGWMDEKGDLRPLRHHIPPQTPVYLAGRDVIERFVRPGGDWKLLLGVDPSSELEVELDMYHLIRQSCLICGSVGSGKTTTAISLIYRASLLNPPVRFFIVDKDGEYGCLVERLPPETAIRVPWRSFFQPSEIPWEDYLSEFGWQKTWWNSKILFRALRSLYSAGNPVTKPNLRRALKSVTPDSIGFGKKETEFESYIQQVLNSINSSRLIPESETAPIDPIELLGSYRIVIMDLSHGKDSWSQKQVVIAQALRRIFNEALENKLFGCVIVLEEAMYYAPQRGVFEIGTKESRSRLLSILKEIATNGGRNGVGLWIVTQRLATVDKTVVTQCANNIICHSLEDLDKQRLAEIVGGEFVNLLGDLPRGEAIVKGTALKCRFPVWVRVLPEVFPSSSTSSPISRFKNMETQTQELEIPPIRTSLHPSVK